MNDTMHENDSVESQPSAMPAVPELSQLMLHLLKGVLYRADEEQTRFLRLSSLP